jgi:hypothetical protein
VAVWSFAEVRQQLLFEAVTDRAVYRRGQHVQLTLRLTNRAQSRYELPAGLMNRTARILFMEREGRGQFAVAMARLFRTTQLVIDPGQTVETRLVLRPADVSERTEVLHYDFPEKAREFQVFLPLAQEQTEGFRNALGANVSDVRVADSWVTGRVRRAQFLSWLLGTLRRLFRR